MVLESSFTETSGLVAFLNLVNDVGVVVRPVDDADCLENISNVVLG